jgi:hypothetical protein
MLFYDSNEADGGSSEDSNVLRVKVITINYSYR